MKYYAGIGARKAPDDIMKEMTRLSFGLRNGGFILRSGGAAGSDSAFMAGAGSKSEIFTANQFSTDNGHFSFPPWVQEEVEKHCWECPIHNMKPYIGALVKRNMMQILGKDGKSPVEFVICWTPTEDPCDPDAGGTRYATRCAIAHGIPVFNMSNQEHLKIVKDIILHERT